MRTIISHVSGKKKQPSLLFEKHVHYILNYISKIEQEKNTKELIWKGQTLHQK